MSGDTARQHLENVVLPFWLSHGIDRQAGGFFTCFDNRGQRRVSTDKFTWSQGRFIWLLSRAAKLARDGRLSADPEMLLSYAEAGARFVVEHSINDDATTRFVVGGTGGPAETGNQPDRSVYADWFVAMGLSELAHQTGEAQWLDTAARVLARGRDDHLAGTAPTPPYAVPQGHEAYGPRMILANTLLVAAQAASALGRHEYLRDQLAESVEEVLGHRQDDGTFTEMPGPDPDSLVTRHRVPGHAIEGIWVVLEALDTLGDERDRTPLLDSVPALCELGWDPEHGGIFRYTDSTGPTQPTGTERGTAYEQLVLDTWSTKLWWVHSEAAATTAIAARQFNHPGAEAWFQRIWDYTMDTFPGGEAGAEWIQIRDRAGAPMDQVVALPVKDPFHIARNLMQLVELESSHTPS